MQNGYKGFYSSNYLPLALKSVNDIHKRGGTILGTSRGGHMIHRRLLITLKIMGLIRQTWFYNCAHRHTSSDWRLTHILAHCIQVYIIGGDGTQKGAYDIFKVIITGHMDSWHIFFPAWLTYTTIETALSTYMLYSAGNDVEIK